MNARQQLNRRDFLARVAAGVALITSTIALGTSVVGLGSPGPSSPGFTGSYVQKSPSITQTVQPVADILPLRVKYENGSGYTSDILDLMDETGTLGFQTSIANSATPKTIFTEKITLPNDLNSIWRIVIQDNFNSQLSTVIFYDVFPSPPRIQIGDTFTGGVFIPQPAGGKPGLQLDYFNGSIPLVRFGDSTGYGLGAQTGTNPGQMDIMRLAAGGNPNLTVRSIPFGTPTPSGTVASTGFEFHSRDPRGTSVFEWLAFYIFPQTEIDIDTIATVSGVLMPIVFKTRQLGSPDIESMRINGTSGGTDTGRVSYATAKTPVQHNRGINEAAPGGILIVKNITFITAEEDANYGVLISPQGANVAVWITNKATGGFTINYGVAGGVVTDWMVFR